MHDERKEVFNILQGDDVLLNMLADNKPFWNQDKEAEKKFSILPADKITVGMRTPFVTIQIMNDVLVGENIVDVFIAIRCYNEKDKAFVTTDEVLSRVKALLHRTNLGQYGTNNVDVRSTYESTGTELEDQAYGLLFRESQYRIRHI